MNNIKNFLKYFEELSPDTYDDISRAGLSRHDKRGERISNMARELKLKNHPGKDKFVTINYMLVNLRAGMDIPKPSKPSNKFGWNNFIDQFSGKGKKVDVAPKEEVNEFDKVFSLTVNTKDLKYNDDGLNLYPLNFRQRDYGSSEILVFYKGSNRNGVKVLFDRKSANEIVKLLNEFTDIRIKPNDLKQF